MDLKSEEVAFPSSSMKVRVVSSRWTSCSNSPSYLQPKTVCTPTIQTVCLYNHCQTLGRDVIHVGTDWGLFHQSRKHVSRCSWSDSCEYVRSILNIEWASPDHFWLVAYQHKLISSVYPGIHLMPHCFGNNEVVGYSGPAYTPVVSRKQ